MSLWIEYILFFDLHFLSFVCSALKSEAYSEVFHRNELFTDIQVFDHILWDKLTISSQDCAQHCFTATDCRSMSYNYVTGVCQGFTADFRIETVPGIVDNGWIHYTQIIQGCEQADKKRSGVYFLNPSESNSFKAFCNMDIDGGGWLVIQRRQDGLTDFRRSWVDYKEGFGNLEKDFWLGNDKIHHVTSSGCYELRIDLADWTGNTWYAVYKTFKIDGVSNQFQLTIGNYSGTAGDSMAYHDAMKFTTDDNDNDEWPTGVCTTFHGGGGWWYYYCDNANLNGLYTEGSGEQGIEWTMARSGYSMKYARMMIRKY